MRILIVYPGPTHSTYDVAVGYDKALRALGHTVEAFHYHKYIQFYSIALSEQEKANPDYKREIEDPFFLASERVALRVVDFVPDVVLIIAGGALHRRAHELIRKLSVPMVLLLTESPYLDDFQAKIITQGFIDMTLTNDKNSVTALRDLTGKRVEYLPHSYDPNIHYPGPVDEKLATDVFFHGTLWPEREALFAPLQRLPRVQISGYTLDKTEVAKNIIPNPLLASLYRSTKIALNHHRTYTESSGEAIREGQAHSIGPRAYEIAACGAFQLCDDTRPELQEVFGDSVVTYHDATDLRRKIDYYLLRECERVDHALKAWYAVRSCTFEDRANTILIPVLEEVTHGR
jgi:spore maturation protein CgeB